ncbi:MAG: hypothetical protein IKN63_02815 [Bacilli bacterium]|nr:hypothetical protein [Bacilli bacterium]
MKEASGELSMTLIVIVAAGVILAIFLAFKEPITNTINNMWGNFTSAGEKNSDCKTYGTC